VRASSGESIGPHAIVVGLVRPRGITGDVALDLGLDKAPARGLRRVRRPQAPGSPPSRPRI
jgi:hypothetical protein